MSFDPEPSPDKPLSDRPSSPNPSDGLVNELRNVLNGLGPSTPPPSAERAPLQDEPAPLREEPAPLREEPAPQVEPPAAPSNGDDFWSGNVLGWPSSTTPDDTPAAPPAAPTPSESWSNEEPAFSAILPEAPTAPFSDDSMSFTDIAVPSGELTGEAFREEPPQPPQQGPVTTREPSREPRNFPDFDIPIPGTMEKKPAPVSAPPETKELELEGNEAKPDGLVQVACVFPEGSEKQGQQFVAKLREIGEKSRTPLNVQAVFVHPWSHDKVDVAAWQKSAVLSGADLLFVLVGKDDMNLFRTLNSNRDAKPRSRLINIDHLNNRALYADVLIELHRSANGKG